MTATAPPEGEPAAPEEPVPEEGQTGVLGARRPESTCPRQERRDPALVPGQERQGQPRERARPRCHRLPPIATRARGRLGGYRGPGASHAVVKGRDGAAPSGWRSSAAAFGQPPSPGPAGGASQ